MLGENCFMSTVKGCLVLHGSFLNASKSRWSNGIPAGVGRTFFPRVNLGKAVGIKYKSCSERHKKTDF